MSKGKNKWYGLDLIECVKKFRKKVRDEQGIKLSEREASDLMGRNVDLDEVYRKIFS